MTVSRFHVAGMDCAAEEQLVRMALSDIDQINRIDADLEQRAVLIDHTTATDTIATDRFAPASLAMRMSAPCGPGTSTVPIAVSNCATRSITAFHSAILA